MPILTTLALAAAFVAKTTAGVAAYHVLRRGTNAVVGLFKKKQPPAVPQPSSTELMRRQQQFAVDMEAKRREFEMKKAAIDARVRESLQASEHNHQLQLQANQEAHTLQLEYSRQKHQDELEKRRMQIQLELALRNEKFQKEVEHLRQKGNLTLEETRQIGQRNLATLSHLLNKEHSIFLLNRQTEARRNELMFQKALAEFPLHLSPLILLENNKDAILNIEKRLRNSEIEGKSNNNETSLFEELSELQRNPLPVHVFITNLQTASRLDNNKMFSNFVWDSVIQKVESLFLGEYGRDSERPVLFYPAAWKQDTKPGLHAEENLYYFLRELPCLVVEPRFDGKRLQIIFSGWGIGYKEGRRFREELNFAEINMQAILATEAFIRSSRSLEQMENQNIDTNPVLKTAVNKWRHNLDTFQQLDFPARIENASSDNKTGARIEDLDSLGEYSGFFCTEKSDMVAVAEQVSAAIGTLLGATVDAHHLLVTATKPIMPSVCTKYFGDTIGKDYAGSFREFYANTYNQIANVLPEKDIQINLAETLASFPQKIRSEDESTEKAILARAKESLREWILEISTKRKRKITISDGRINLEKTLGEALPAATREDDEYLASLQHVLHSIGKKDEAKLVELRRIQISHDSKFNN